MTSPRTRRLAMLVVLVCGAAAAIALALAALQQNINLFYSPSQIAAQEAPQRARIRVGGLVQAGSVQRSPDSLAVQFGITDGAHQVPVRFQGILPDLFRENQGIVALGSLDESGTLHADEVLAKHDENYMPPEAAHALATSAAAGARPPLPATPDDTPKAEPRR
ncbi:cytochrome c biogenesis protein CcmE [Bordetella genomosp. 7]|uniref:cytochrome c maturation protein CcmE n=1 Tax=Bordetella TaxID=517 RepID=UPI0009DFCD1B|nr:MULTISPECIES: cytochrome c maturation protein CcmE [Bordetella]OZI17481.1 cytochrome c biogenesis protein CcmE [Bordetella genomosp. 7]